MKDFAKVFATQYGQVVVFLQANEEGHPEIRMFSQPQGLGVCSAAFGYDDSDDGWAAAEKGFELVTAEMAEASAKQLAAYGEQE